MSNFSSIPITFRTWLATATKGIASWDQERIEREIRAHYDDAVAEGLAQGLHQEEAERVALESLGSAKKARRKNRKTCSSDRTEKILDSLVDLHPKKGKFVWGRKHWITALFLTPLSAAKILTAFYEHDPFAMASTIIVIPVTIMWYLLLVAIPDFADRRNLKKEYLAQRAFELMFIITLLLPQGIGFAHILQSHYFIWILLFFFGYFYELQKELRNFPKNLSRDDVLRG